MSLKINPQELLSIWEGYWGKLDSEWAEKFLLDSRIQKILHFPDSAIYIAVERNRKLDAILVSLHDTSSPELHGTRQVPEIQNKPGMNNAIKRMQIERALEPKIPDQDWWRES